MKALLVFCEGPHDVAYTRLVFHKLLNFKTVSWKFSEMPAPFNTLFAKAVTKHAASDLSLDMAHKFFLPDTVLEQDSQVVLIFNCGGKTNYENIRVFLSDFLLLLENAQTFSQDATFIISAAKYLFMNDADQEGIDQITQQLTLAFRDINGKTFLGDDWQASGHDFGRIAGDKALYILAETPERGTLEDIIYPLFCHEEANNKLIQTAEGALKEMFSLDTGAANAPNIAARAKLKKAVLTTAGQKKKPGSSFAVILEQSKLITTEALLKSPKAQDFVQFIQKFGEIST